MPPSYFELVFGYTRRSITLHRQLQLRLHHSGIGAQGELARQRAFLARSLRPVCLTAQRILYGKPVLQMPHIRLLVAQAAARLIAMKTYACRALDYVYAANAKDRRYLLYCAVQKAKVSTESRRSSIASSRT